MFPQSMIKRYWSKVHKTDDCWLWTGYYMSNGHAGVLKLKGKYQYVHRIAWALEHGEMPKGVVKRTCGNHQCVNPEHLLLKPFEHGGKMKPVRLMTIPEIEEIFRLSSMGASSYEIARAVDRAFSTVYRTLKNEEYRRLYAEKIRAYPRPVRSEWPPTQRGKDARSKDVQQATKVRTETRNWNPYKENRQNA